MIDRIGAKEQARAVMSQGLGAAVGANLFQMMFLPVPFLSKAAQLGLVVFYLRTAAGERPRAASILDGMDNTLRAAALFYWQLLWVFLWSAGPSLAVALLSSLLAATGASGLAVFLRVAGGLFCSAIVIYKLLQYSLCFYLLADQPSLRTTECLRMSIELTRGHLAELLMVRLSFLGWYILNIFTFNLLAFFWLNPYYHFTSAFVYRQLADPPQAGGGSPASGYQGSGPSRARNYGSMAPRSAPPGGTGGPGAGGAAAEKAGIPTRMGLAGATMAEPGLRGMRGMYAGQIFRLRAGEAVSLGRDGRFSQIVLSQGAELVSRLHCHVVYDASSASYVVTDVSKNGTFLADGSRLAKELPVRLSKGSVISLGSSENSFCLL